MKEKLKKIPVSLLLLPGMIVAAYLLIWSRPVTTALKRVGEELKRSGTVEELQMQRVGLHSEEQRLQASYAELMAEPELAPAPPAPAAGSALRRLQSIFRQQQIRLVSAAAMKPEQSSSAGRSDPVHASFKEMGCSAFERWHVTVQASYSGIVGLLESCVTSAPPVVVESLDLSVAGGEQQLPYWTVQLCL